MLLKSLSSLLGCLALSQSVASSLLPREGDDSGGHTWINHDAVVPFTQKPSVVGGSLELRFNPFLYVSGGCDPYPAVDAQGNLGAGLKPTGGGRSGCGDGGSAQVYVRRGESQGRKAIIYSYYMPKVRWAKGNNNGHRHYWASVVVWVNRFGCDDSDITSIWPVGISYTTDHLNWGSASAGEVSFRSSDVGIDMATHPKIQIHDEAIAPFTGADGDKLFERTLISWDSLPAAAKQALKDVKYEKTQVPFTDEHFQAQIDAAYRDGFYAGVSKEPDCPSNDVPPADNPPVTATAATPEPTGLDK
ncbi:NPP1 domain-containing protein [Colletotrichum salicis]|uniref:NPP1 domain-containing protein n=1 Tax=Colletotrichum salicis TaxID=1209931 RepID=A0A135V9W4_9PEZI|nr:NPP1 domain-containing protein [Colletotrichum salicis]